MIDLTIVIPSFEARDCLLECLAALEVARKSHPELRFEVIIVDNGSRDGSVAVAQDSPLRPRLVVWVRNRGFAAAVNAGMRMRRGRHVLLLNSDVRITPDLLVAGVHALDEESGIGVLGPALFHPDGRSQRSVHALPGFMTECLPGPLLRWLRPAGAARRRTSEQAAREVEAIRGAVFFIRGELLEKLGLFDEGYFFFLEETDYCARVRATGSRVVHDESMRAEHRLGASSKQRAPLATRIEFHRSLYRFLGRWRGPGCARWARFLRTFRNALNLLLLAPAALVWRSARGKAAERAGLVLWHLRGCPGEPSLADEMRRAIARAEREPADSAR